MKDQAEYQRLLGQVITTRREKLGYSREKFARILGKGTDYITSVEDGNYSYLNLSDMILIATALQLPLSTLLALVESN
ncbi:helix-turn-helix transcriptional regulator [bacterium]|nr:helix-turn-helix transcriptional regulator [bacterium]